MAAAPQNVVSRFYAALDTERAGRLDEAEALYREILADFPAEAGAMDRVGALTLARGDAEGALGWFQAALSVQPTFGPAAVNAGITLQHLGRLDEAEAVLAQIAKLTPDFAAGHYMLGQVLWEKGAFDRACESLGRAIVLAPEFIADNYDALNRRLNECDWRGYEAMTAMMTRRIRAGASVTSPLSFMYYSDSPADQARCVRSYAAVVHPPLKPLWTGQERRPGRIRLAYVSPDFHQHAVTVVMAGVYEHHDRDAFELFAFSLGQPSDDAIRARVTPAFDHFIEAGHLPDEQIAALIREHDIDIAINLAGYTWNCRPNVLACRPAPVQVNFLGYPGTLGVSYIDYIIADREVIPREDFAHYSEKIVWMPHAYQPTDDKTVVAEEVPDRAGQGLPESGFVFSAYNPTRKITPAIFDVWMRILARTPGSVLWLQPNGEASIANLRREAETRGVDPARICFAPWAEDRDQHLSRQRLADLYLDTLPYNAHSIASDHLWTGLPVLTCQGRAFPSRVCASLLQAAGCADLITEDLTAYEDLAVALAHDPARLAALRARIEAEVRSTPLFQTALYTRHLERAFKTMFDRRQKGLPPEYFEVPAAV